jgi:hypothetical protein
LEKQVIQAKPDPRVILDPLANLEIQAIQDLLVLPVIPDLPVKRDPLDLRVRPETRVARVLLDPLATLERLDLPAKPDIQVLRVLPVLPAK